MATLVDSGTPAPQPGFESIQYRNRAEIASILQGLICDGIPISADIGSSRPFISHLLAITPASGHFYIAYGANKMLNSVLFERNTVVFTANQQDNNLAFQVSGPAVSMVDGKPAIRFALPLLLTQLRRRARATTPAEVSLRCIADEGGFLSFETRIVGLSLDGSGAMMYDSGINLEPGTILKASRIIGPDGKSVIADLEVRETSTEILPDGSSANRAVLRFALSTAELEPLYKAFARKSVESSSGTQ